MIVLDANVLIAYWGAPDVHTTRALEILDTEDDLALHPVTLAESLVGPVRIGAEQEALADLVRLGIDRHEPLLDEPLRVARLRARTRLKIPDLYVLAAALEHDSVLATFDSRLADAAREHGLEVMGA